MQFRRAMLTMALAVVPFIADGQASRQAAANGVRIDDSRIEEIISNMPLRRKIGQLVICTVQQGENKRELDRLAGYAKRGEMGGVIVMDGDLEVSTEMVNDLQRACEIPLLVALDAEWGASMRYHEFPSFQRQMQIGALPYNKYYLAYDMGKAVAKQLLSVGVQINFAPDVDINNNPDNPAINTRSFGEDRARVARLGREYMWGMQHGGVFTSAKHFPGHGDTNVDSHADLPVLPFTRGRLDSIELYPFRKLIASGVDMVMLGHLCVPELDPTGTAASISSPIINGLLREELGFDGIVITDALGMQGLVKDKDRNSVALEAYRAGVDILLMPADAKIAVDQIESAIKKGELDMAGLDARLRKVLRMKAACGMLDHTGNDFCINTEGLDKVATDRPSDKQLIQDISDATMTAVKGDCRLPVGRSGKISRGRKVAYVGYRADSDSEAMAERLSKAGVDTFFVGHNAEFLQDRPLGEAQIDTEAATRASRQAESMLSELQGLKDALADYDLIVMAFHGTSPRPQRNFGIDDRQYDFIGKWAAEQPMFCVYFGSPYALGKMPWYTGFKSVLIAYSNTVENNIAAAKVLLGEIPALGQLPVSIPR